MLLNRRRVVDFPGADRPKLWATTTVPLMAMAFSGGTGLRSHSFGQNGICMDQRYLAS